MANAEELMNLYYSLKEANDIIERELEGRKIESIDWDSAVAAEMAKRDDIRSHRFDEAYAREKIQNEFERSDRLRALTAEKNLTVSKEKERREKEQFESRQREYDEYLRDERRREEEYRREEERREEERQREYYEQKRREEEEYERRRRADEEYYYDQLRRRGY